MDSRFVSKVSSGFPDYLDWEKLRAEGLDYLGKLSGKIWTDHNIHDPGITILETLCYALMDLGYRTNLPVEDILARNPEDKTKENNFFTASEILSCNPLTIIDFRKLLIDIDGVRNAWLEDSFYECEGRNPNSREAPCSDCYNGLYKVYVEAEKVFDLKKPEDKEEQNDLLKRIRDVLMSHRNLCEDFIDIYILCRQPIGLCLDVELEVNADAEEVYKNLVEALRSFFSPSPRFYTLKQLLEDKKKSIEDIFSGRPYNTNESHGFIDTDELEQIKLRKEIHLSDVYTVVLGVVGVRNVNNLAWKENCSSTPDVNKKWVWRIPENHIPDFSASCSVFNFNRRGIPVFVDTKKFVELFAIDFTHNGKVPYKMPSPYLDLEMPKGSYRSDLGDYQSIQTEFPKVYGIGNGTLPSNVTDRRKAQAYQLKGYLLFYDQLLANYVAQLKNLRSLFAFTSPEKKQERHSYFLNQLTDVPDLNKLLRFNDGAGDDEAAFAKGDTMAIAAKRKPLEDAIRDGSIKNQKREDFLYTYTYPQPHSCQLGISIIQQEMLYGDFGPGVASTSEHCWFFYFFTSSPDIALVSSDFYETESKALEAGNSAKFAAGRRENYHLSIDQSGDYSFTLDLTLFSYSQYLQQLVEDDWLYNQRREGFLDHLLSRFAEQFTDFALLSFGFLKEKELIKQDVHKKEKFLTKYGDLSSNRGKSFDYWLDGWNNENLSGFEKRSLAMSGLGELKRHHLCHFVVEEFEEYYLVNIRDSHDAVLFSSSNRYYSKEAAWQAAKESLLALANRDNFTAIEDRDSASTRLQVNCGSTKSLMYKVPIIDSTDVDNERNALQKFFSLEPEPGDVFVSKTVFRIILRDSDKKELASSKKHFDQQEQAVDFLAKADELIRDSSKWNESTTTAIDFKDIQLRSLTNGDIAFINLPTFKIHSSDDVVGKPGKWEFSLLDTENSFKLNSQDVYDSQPEAIAACRQLLIYLATEPGLAGEAKENGEKFELEIKLANQLITQTDPVYDTKDLAEEAWAKIKMLLKRKLYWATVEEVDYRWSFTYLLGYKKEERFLFRSTEAFDSAEHALTKAKDFYKAIRKISLGAYRKEPALTVSTPGDDLVCAYDEQPGSSSGKDTKAKMNELLDFKKRIHAALQSKTPEAFDSFITNDVSDRNLKYVFRLVDKDNYHAVFKGGFDRTTASSASKVRSALYQTQLPYQYTDILLGGDILHERKDAVRNIKWYHYQVKSRGRGVNKNETLLFESVKGYRSKEDALKAFDDNYLLILHRAQHKKNYGKDKFISLDELIQHAADDCEQVKSVVFVPEETKKDFNWYPDIIIGSIRTIVKQYPVRYVTKQEDIFYKLFPCEVDHRTKDEKESCDKKNDGDKHYYFVLLGANGREYWQSLNYFASHDEAMQRFHFFLMLLRYPGNYFVQQDYCYCEKNSDGETACCQWQVLIREVLAESKRRFTRKELAWQAIEEFICIAQSKDGFQTYLNDENCSYTFQVSCNQSGMIHPCKYDTDKERDEARKKLIAAAVFPPVKYPELKQIKQKEWQFLDKEGKPLAIIVDWPDDPNNKEELKYPCVADLLLDIFTYMPNFQAKTGVEVYGKDTSGNKVKLHLVKSFDENIEASEWKKMLCEAACSYPIIKNEKGKYEVVIRYKGVSCHEKVVPPKYCDPAVEQLVGEDECAVSWKSECCFETCDAAWDFYEEEKKCLAQADHYLRVFDCECGPFGIKLNCDCNERRVIQEDTLTQPAGRPGENTHLERMESVRRTANPCCSEVIAFNPQRYATPKMDCDAVERAKRLINNEGLYVVEHILLRPRCEEDCGCMIPVCDNKVIRCAGLEWVESGDKDPCDPKIAKIAFEPGADPYSFIATVVLPAWPERFRKKENLLLLENLLYREAPAHVMIRILWLTPRDFCLFETKYKQWSRWGIQKLKGCTDFSLCDFRDFLFEKSFRCLPDCDTCQPCSGDEANNNPCKETQSNPCDEKFLVQNNINKLFCWNELVCDDEDKTVRVVAANLTAEIHKPQTEMKTLAATKAKPTRTPEQVANRRRKKYLTKANEIAEHSGEHPVAVKVQSFLQTTPSPETTSALLTEIIQNKPGPKKGKALNVEQLEDLVKITICYFMDKLSFPEASAEMNAKERGNRLEKIFQIADVLKKVRRSVKKMESIYLYWEPHEVKESEPDVPIENIERLLTGKLK